LGRSLSLEPLDNSVNSGQHPQSESVDLDIFRPLFEADKNRLYCYIYAYVHDNASADDIFQETCLTLWKEFRTFKLGTDFSKWSNSIAFNRIRVYRRNQNKYQLGLSNDFLDEFRENLGVIESSHDAEEKRWRQLLDCKMALSPQLKKIYDFFYVDKLMAQDIADDTGRSIYAIRKSVHKLRKYLFDCVERQLSGSDK
jgi:RNA polymerase sigma-70 factor (ECF subfamily)